MPPRKRTLAARANLHLVPVEQPLAGVSTGTMPPPPEGSSERVLEDGAGPEGRADGAKWTATNDGVDPALVAALEAGNAALDDIEKAKRTVAAMSAKAKEGERERGVPEDDQAHDPAAEFFRGPGSKHSLFDGIPADTAFGDDDEAIEDETRLRQMGLWLIKNRDELRHLNKRVLLFFWHKEGGTPSGKPAIEGATRMRGYARAAYQQLNDEAPDWAIWLAADHLRKVKPTIRQIEAALYHALRHAQETSKGKPTTAPHEFEGFKLELSLYGAWNRELLDLIDALDRKPAPDVVQTELGKEYTVDETGVVNVVDRAGEPEPAASDGTNDGEDAPADVPGGTVPPEEGGAE